MDGRKTLGLLTRTSDPPNYRFPKEGTKHHWAGAPNSLLLNLRHFRIFSVHIASCTEIIPASRCSRRNKSLDSMPGTVEIDVKNYSLCPSGAHHSAEERRCKHWHLNNILVETPSASPKWKSCHASRWPSRQVNHECWRGYPERNRERWPVTDIIVLACIAVIKRHELGG